MSHPWKMMISREQRRLIRWFDEPGTEDIPLPGGKNASLGEMFQQLTAKGGY